MEVARFGLILLGLLLTISAAVEVAKADTKLDRFAALLLYLPSAAVLLWRAVTLG